MSSRHEQADRRPQESKADDTELVCSDNILEHKLNHWETLITPDQT